MNIPVTQIVDSAVSESPGKVKSTARFARGWHCLGLSRHYGEEPKSLDYFGTRLVAYRGADYKVHILDAFCPHMGADMAHGTVNGNSLVCPFHRWEWGTDGVCSHIPYSKSIPPKARIKSWPTLEKNGLLYIWNDPEGNPPIPEQEIPDQPEYYSDEWADWQVATIRVNNNNRELIDNMADMGHFGPVHGALVKTFTNIVKGHTFTQVMEGGSIEGRAEMMHSVATYYGPAVMTTQMEVVLNGGLKLESRLLVANVPVNENCFELRFGLLFKRIPGVSRDICDYVIQRHVDSTTKGFLDDVAIWHNKTRIDNPVLCEGDGPIYKLRQWYEQFYVDVAEVGNKWVEEKTYVTHLDYGQ